MGPIKPRCLLRGLIMKLLLLLLHISMSYGSNEHDIDCLRAIKDAFEDPFDHLSSWDFSNHTEGFLCSFDGVGCWNDQENKVLAIQLNGFGLKGEFPRGVVNCTSLTNLDLSSNNLFGGIPSDISKLIPYVTILQLSSNSFSGDIPSDISNCRFLNEVQLNNNQLSGKIPAEIGSLTRLGQFSVANNNLVGPIPMSVSSRFPADNFANNSKLTWLDQNEEIEQVALIQRPDFLVGAAIGWAIFTPLFSVIGTGFFIYLYDNADGGAESNKCARRISWTRIKVSKSRSSLKESEFRELAKATNNFSREHITGFQKAGKGTLYRAALKDGTVYTVKRLHYSTRLLRECELKMPTMVSIRHPNLVSLVGYCVANKEMFLVYEHMTNGSLYDQLHSYADKCIISYSPVIRLKFAIGVARGLAWLHHYSSPRIIHQNITSRCILLDACFIPKISDFGLVTVDNPINKHSGYLAPEHARTRVVSPKRDVYSFGVVLLELITGEMPTFVAKAHYGFNGSLVKWVMQLSDKPDLKAAIDAQLIGKGFDDELIEFLKVACTCVASDPVDRPSMLQVHRRLTAILSRYHISPQASEVDGEV